MKKNKIIPVFLSRPNPFIMEHSTFLNNLIQKLQYANLENITLEAKDYNPYESLSCMIEQIKRCYGMIIIAFGQYYIESGISKKGAVTDQSFFEPCENPINQVWVTSPFCQIEGTIAFSNRLPILILEQEGVKVEGILQCGEHAIHGPNFKIGNTEQINTYFTNPKFCSCFDNWYSEVLKLYDFTNKIVE